MSNVYTANNMMRFLGTDATDADAVRMGEYLEQNGWELLLDDDGEFVAYKDGRRMTEPEWHAALKNAFA